MTRNERGRTDHGDDDERTCATCGADIDPTEWHPVVTSGGDVYRIHAFCDPECRDVWLDD